MTYGLKQAAKATGKSKATILRAIQSHKISAIKHEISGAYQIDPAELHRLYPPVAEGGAHHTQNNHLSQYEAHHGVHETGILRRDLEHAAEKIAALRADLERERETTHDLRRRLDDTEAKRERVTAQLTALLTDQRDKTPEPTTQAAPRRRFWLFR